MAGERWPFLIAAGLTRDYRVLMAPDFLVAAGEYGRLGDAVRPGSEGGVSTVRAGELVVTYTGRLVRAADAGLAGDDYLRDGQGRPIMALYGYVTTGNTPVDPEVFRAEAFEVFRAFLADERRFTVVPSRTEHVPGTAGNAEKPAPTRLRPALIAAAVAVVLAAAAGGFAYADRDRPAPRIEPSACASASPTTGDPLVRCP